MYIIMEKKKKNVVRDSICLYFKNLLTLPHLAQNEKNRSTLIVAAAA